MKHYTKNEHITIFFMYALSACCVIIITLLHVTARYTSTKKDVRINTSLTDFQPVSFDSSLFKTVRIEGKAYIVYDLMTNSVIASENEATPLPLASITKIMTAVSATRHAPKDSKVTILPKSIEDGYDLGLKKDQSWSLSELLKYTLVFSSNDGAEAIADTFGGSARFITQMNNDAKDLGINAIFTDPAGRDINGEIGGKGSVLDAAKLFGVARKYIPELLDATTKKRQTVISSFGRISGVPNTNQSIESFPGAEGSKTGYTDLAGGNLGIIVDISLGHPVVIVVLGSTREGRFRDVSLLYETLHKSLKTN